MVKMEKWSNHSAAREGIYDTKHIPPPTPLQFRDEKVYCLAVGALPHGAPVTQVPSDSSVHMLT